MSKDMDSVYLCVSTVLTVLLIFIFGGVRYTLVAAPLKQYTVVKKQ